MARVHEIAAMRRAIAISAQGLGSTSPNPAVGCVILDNEGRTVGEGYHVRKGESHAEVNALEAAGSRADGGTAVVTLEPCNHHGRTPPCREALIKAGVTRVLIAVMDPTSRGEGGATLLRKASIEVEEGFLKDEALLVLGPWLDSVLYNRPFFAWIYEAAPDGSPVPHSPHGAVCHEARTLGESFDLVIRSKKEFKEGRPGEHGSGAFHTPENLDGDTGAVLDILRLSGVRSVLLEGDAGGIGALARSGVIDQVIVYLANTPHSLTHEKSVIRGTAIPDGYELTAVNRLERHVRLVGRRN
jgi:diaminohydroxyphosphoribosylaminopyrimidine deaminase / 5-amino-6-(5-phosphoribosylamino)uracil reductase